MTEDLMYKHLPKILELQNIDAEIDKLKQVKAKIPLDMKKLNAELEKQKERYESQKTILEELQKHHRSKERNLAVQQEQLEKYKSQRNAVKTNREYTALEEEISELEDATSEIEDEILELMISIDEANDRIEEAEKEYKTHEASFKEKRNVYMSDMEGFDKEIAKWQKTREKVSKNINPALMQKYKNWRKRRGGTFVAVIHGQSCGGCHLRLPPQLVNEVRKREQLYTCNSCGRILYWEEEEEPEKAQLAEDNS
ncbi:hypothetical protein GF312_12810 [Candidatus Poribacteria bacterium]|nr:hypothetical protein [Candidatus Poribacteria bacterium]